MSPLARLRGTGLAHRLASLLGMLAIVVQLGLPILHDPAGLGAVAPWLGVAICHAGSGGGPAAPADKKSALCPICLGLQGTAAALLPPHPGMIALASLPVSEPMPPSRDEAQLGRDPGGSTQPRAPPHSV